MGNKCEEIELLIMSIFKIILVLSNLILKQRIMITATLFEYYARNDKITIIIALIFV